MKLKKLLKPYFLIPLLVLVLVAAVFVGWQIAPKKQLNVALLDKTVPAADDQSEGDISGYERYYRKHMGLYWLLEQQKYVKAGDKTFYDYTSDYFGPMISEDGQVLSNRELSSIDFIPDVLYLADAYGSELYDNEYRGLSQDDMGVTSLAYSQGAAVIAEMELLGSTGDAAVSSELQKLCGISATGWVGRYIYELQDFTDVPEWAPPAYEQRYGAEWHFSGPGILLASSDGDIIVLEEKTDFESKNLLRIYINEEYKKEFGGCNRLNFYNWFELIVPESGTENLATFEFDLNATGMEKFKEISKAPRFAAVTRKTAQDRGPVYYFAGDFNDYVQEERVTRFLFADTVYRWISFNREGDISNFYWNFYNPLMKKILNDAYKAADHGPATEPESGPASRISEDRFQVKVDGEWTDLSLNAFNINAVEPGHEAGDVSRDFTFYQRLVSELSAMGGDCLRAYDLLSPEFYRAVYEHNREPDARKLYILQGIGAPAGLEPAEYLTETGRTALEANLRAVLKAVHGEGRVEAAGSRPEGIYLHDVSDCLLGYLIDLKLDAAGTAALTAADPAYTYSGAYVGGTGSPAEGLYARLCDTLLKMQADTYGFLAPVGAEGNQDLLAGAAWNTGEASFDLGRLSVTGEAEDYFFLSYALQPGDSILLDNTARFETYLDDQGSFPYGGYIREIKALSGGHPVLVDAFGLSTNTNAFEKESNLYGLSEQEQGNGIVRMLKAIRQEGFLGGFISDLNDSWSGCSEELLPYTVSLKNNPLWHNMLDPAQTAGVLAMEAREPDKIGMELNDSGAMKQVQFFANEEYLYLTIQLDKEVDYDAQQMFVGLDTYQRNDGEYLYDKAYFANSLSGMEYVVKFESKNTAALYVTSSYNRNTGHLSSKEGYDADWDLVTQLSYGNFTSSNTHFYMTGTTVRIRLPWSMLNFTDPSQKLVVNDDGPLEEAQVRTTSTNGVMFSLFIGDKLTGDTAYIFPAQKQSTGYKNFSWDDWETVDYTLRRKESFQIIQQYFTGS